MNLWASLARLRIPVRQGFLFLLAIVVPCLLVLGLSVRMLDQERELSGKRIADERHRLAGEFRQRLVARLERIELEALGGRARTRGAPKGERGASSDVALVAPLERGQVILPWDASATAEHVRIALDAPQFSKAMGAGEHSEYLERRFEEAAVLYRTALSVATEPEQRASARLALARVLANAGHRADAGGLARDLLRDPPSVVDDQGVPFGFYAMRRILEGAELSAPDVDAIFGFLEAAIGAEPMLPPVALYMAGELCDRLAARIAEPLRVSATRLRQALNERTRDAEQMMALQTALPSLVAASDLASTPADSLWQAFGPDERLWLVNLAHAAGADVDELVAVRAAPTLALADESGGSESMEGNGTLRLTRSADGEPLGRNFPGLGVALPASATMALTRQASLQRAFYTAALVLVLGVALCGGYLFWRDVQRDLHVSLMRSQFVSSVSHELKTPLTAIRMFAETLRMRCSISREDREDYLDTIVNESERLTRLLNNVLDFSKIEQGRKIYRLELQAPAAVVRSAAKTMKYPLAQHGFDLRVDVDDNVPAVAIDADALEQAILNLLSNAMKYSGAGRVIDLSLRQEAGAAVIAVTDQGAGVAMSEQARIFEKFYRMAEHQAIPGTGLGLTLVEHTARALGGSVAVRSAPREGSTFSIVIPLAPMPFVDERATA